MLSYLAHVGHGVTRNVRAATADAELLVDPYSRRLLMCLREAGHIREALIVTLEEAVNASHSGNEPSACLRAVLGAALPETGQGVARDVQATERFLERLRRTHASGCTTWALDAWEELDASEGTMKRIRAHLPQRARATELSRLRTVAHAEHAAGYTPD